MSQIQFEALMVQAEKDCVRVILDPFCLEWLAEDVLDVEELPPPEGLIAGSAIPARVTLRAGARMTRLAPSSAYRSLLWKERLPFALVTRTEAIPCDDSTLTAAEDEFFAARGLKDQLS